MKTAYSVLLCASCACSLKLYKNPFELEGTFKVSGSKKWRFARRFFLRFHTFHFCFTRVQCPMVVGSDHYYLIISFIVVVTSSLKCPIFQSPEQFSNKYITIFIF